MGKKPFVALLFAILALSACVDGTSPGKASDEIKGLSSQLDVNHAQKEHSKAAETYARAFEQYVDEAAPVLVQLQEAVMTGNNSEAAALTELLADKAKEHEQTNTFPPPFAGGFEDIHHSYTVSLGELEQALNTRSYEAEQQHYSNASLSFRLMRREYESLITEYGIKASPS
ncbi:hypothetical protein [Shouchella clausii]|uniref:Lipoprotein n=1 Tax=Shouchella clausii TaxID=79880 RepID=A0A268S006_SHOCL|nr:hypothetical protein [Shouchella clausii]PAD41858.1 hypothetical protein CHH54_15060 [Bacillus sp. 7520-S]SPU21353.1 Uncharacterised protein [Niallia circulans]AST97743.1 hypothetical protein BC8716_17985 [Shouchella clausii]MBU8595086.1 hypothetical protein [Shouchella clausii]MCM3549457.1 hypothetical protein [Shouchella clausii]